jgi:hypothetical protein
MTEEDLAKLDFWPFHLPKKITEELPKPKTYPTFKGPIAIDEVGVFSGGVLLCKGSIPAKQLNPGDTVTINWDFIVT